MEVKYNAPIKNESGIYVFEEPIMKMLGGRISGSVKVPSDDDYIAIQDRILNATEKAVDYLVNKQIPNGVEGDVEVLFRIFEFNGGFLNLFTKGEIGFPKFSIQTNYGHSEFYLWPMNEGIQVGVTGGGVAEEVVKALQDDFEKSLGFPDSQLKTYKPSNYGGLATLTSKLHLPKPR